MKGLQLSRAYAEEYGIPMLINKFPECIDKMAMGLVGEGSECFGFDDEFSVDHDFGPGFCIWMPEDVYIKIGQAVQSAYDALPKNYMGHEKISTPNGIGRVGAISIERFYSKYIGTPIAPCDNMEWFRIPETFLATATNGQVFIDNFGKFSEIRSTLKGFYPLDVKKKKLAARLAIMAQSGQYNYVRSQKRGDVQAAYMAGCEFVKAALSAIYIINDSYMPFYKWAFRGLENITRLKETAIKLSNFVVMPDTYESAGKKEQLIEDICIEVGRELNLIGLTRTTDSFLEAHGLEIMQTIEDFRLKNMHIMVDVR
ncbi:MAG: DUF4037 domain-containing protein [Eubacteriales bacterium]